MATNFVSGVEKIEIAPAFFTEAGAGSATWTELEYVATDSVAYTKNSDTQTDLNAEDKDAAVLTFSTPGESDQLTVGLLQQKPEIMAMLENIVYTAATTKVVNLAKRKVANLAFRITTRSVKDDRKLQIVIPNTDVVTTSTGNLTKSAVEQLLLTAKVRTFKTTTGNLDAISIKTWVTASGAAIDSSTP